MGIRNIQAREENEFSTRKLFSVYNQGADPVEEGVPASSSLLNKLPQALKVINLEGLHLSGRAPFCPAETTQPHIPDSTPVSPSSLPGSIQQNIFHGLPRIAHFADLT